MTFVMVQEQFFPKFQLFDPEVKYFYQKNTWKDLLRKESQLPTSLEQFISFIAPHKVRLIV